MFQKEDELSKENYRSASVFSHASKIFERIIFNQMNLSFESKFWPLLKGFCKNHSTQNALLNMIEKWRHALDKGKNVGTIFMDIYGYIHSTFSLMTFSVLYRTLVFATLLIIIYCIQLRMISKKLILF